MGGSGSDSFKKRVEAEITEKVVYGEGKQQRYAFRAKTVDGRNLTKFVKKEDWEKATV